MLYCHDQNSTVFHMREATDIDEGSNDGGADEAKQSLKPQHLLDLSQDFSCTKRPSARCCIE